ncbi:MAG: glycoside hydrolase family 13 protein [Aquirufa sp.]
MKHYLFLFIFIFSSSIPSFSQSLRVEPLNWWVGMKNPKLQILIQGKDLKGSSVTSSLPGLKIEKVHFADSPNYLFVDCIVAPSAKAGNYPLIIKKGGNVIHTVNYRLEAREKGSAQRASFSPKDVIYLITPDRFANGDESNDAAPSLLESQPNRSEMYGRHGGDIKGIQDRLDYIKNMGFTAIWNMPLLENDEKRESYHGYSITNHYQIDPRFGTNEQFRALSQQAKDRGIKMIVDIVLNHIGDGHYWMKDLPFKDWINYGGKFVSTTHHREVQQDPHASKADVKLQVEGWFVPTMPDLNQKNPFLATYLIQNSIWWVEYAHLGGLRIDTYPYSLKEFANQWSTSLLNEYPNLNMVGEEWSSNPIITSYWQKGKINANGFVSTLPSLMDFPLQTVLAESLKENDQEWGKGLMKLYTVLSNDLVYPDPYNLVVFGDNHDMSRFFTQVGNDIDLFKMGMSFVLTTRGIPQIYYGTELLFSNPKSNEHGEIRADFYGGWKGDVKDAVSGKNLTSEEKNAQDFMRKLLNWRKSNDAIHHGKLLHFAPENGVYTYFRYSDKAKVMVVMNKNAKTASIDLKRFEEILPKGSKVKDILNDHTFTLGESLAIGAKTALILELIN